MLLFKVRFTQLIIYFKIKFRVKYIFKKYIEIIYES